MLLIGKQDLIRGNQDLKHLSDVCTNHSILQEILHTQQSALKLQQSKRGFQGGDRENANKWWRVKQNFVTPFHVAITR